MNQYKSFGQVFYVYWKIYGGFSALLHSPYFHLSVLITLICYPLWIGNQWLDVTLGAIPDLLGFSIGAFAVILTFGQRSLGLLKNPKEIDSKYLGVVTAFVHFIVIQALALLVAMIGKSWNGWVIGAIGTLLTVYAIALAVAACMRLFRLARIYNRIKDDPTPEEE